MGKKNFKRLLKWFKDIPVDAWVVCQTKQRYHTLRAATIDTSRLRKQEGRDLRAYTCPVCRFFHLTSHA